MVFTWISAAMLCCPPLLGFTQHSFDKEAYICMLDWGSMAAYSVTLSILILGPSLITIIYTYSYIFSMLRKLRSGVPFHDKEYATALAENLGNPSHMMSFALVVTFLISWTPYIGVKLYEYFTEPIANQEVNKTDWILNMSVVKSQFHNAILIVLSPLLVICLKWELDNGHFVRLNNVKLLKLKFLK